MAIVKAFTALAVMMNAVWGATEQDLVSLVKRGDAATLLQRVGHGSLPDEANDAGRLPLVTAVQQADLKCADVLLNYRANSSRVEPSSGVTALTLATTKGNEQMVELLLKYGGNVDTFDGTGASARTAAKKKGIKELIQRWDDAGAAAFEDMPGTWTRHHPDGHNTPFYHNVKTGESRFMVPPSCAWMKAAVDGHPIYINQVTQQTTWTMPRALSWKRLHAKGGSGPYWYNFATEDTSHEVPAELPVEMVSELTFDGGSYFYNAVSKHASWMDPSERNWREVTDPNGRKFWYHPKTMESTWERPSELAWRMIPSEEHPGHSYFVNDVSGDTSWERPESLAWEKNQFNPHLDSITL